MNQPDFLTTEEVAQYLKVDKDTINRLVAKGKLAAFKVGKQWRFKRSILTRWLNRNKSKPSAH